MIYRNIEEAKRDLHWLVKECSVSPIASLRLTDYEAQAIEKDLAGWDDGSVLAFYELLFEHLGLKEPVWQDGLGHHSLPMLAMVPQEGLCIVMEKEADGSWKCESAEGIQRKRRFPEGTRFASVKVLRTADEKRSAREMFKAIALQEKHTLVYAAIAALSINIFALATSFFSMQVYDRVIPTQGIATLVALGIGVFIAIVLELILKLSRSYLIDGAAANMDVAYSHEIFDRFLKIRPDALPRSVGTLSGQLQSYATVRAFIASAAVYLLIDVPFLMVFLSVIIMLAGWMIGLIVLLFLMAAITAGLLFRNKIVMLSKTSSMASHKKLGLLVESVENAENIKATGAGWSLLSRWNALSEDAVNDDIQIKHYSEMSTYFSGFLQQLSYVSIVMVGAYLVSTTNDLTMGGLIATTILSGRVLSPIAQLPNLLVQWGRTKISIEDLDNVYALAKDNEGVERPLRPSVLKPQIRCENICFAYDDDTVVAKVEKLHIAQGEKVAIVGTIGAGKSTLLKILAGLYKPSDGKIYIDNMDMHQISRNSINETVGYLPQHVKLISGTLRDNLLLGLAGISDEQILEVANRTGLGTLIAALPLGLDTPVPEGGESVSGGQKQLIALTRLILMHPKLILLDEPTSHMDEGSERQILDTLQKSMGPDTTLVLVTHKPALLRLVDRVIVMTAQGVVMDGPKEQVLRQLAAPRKPSVKEGS